MADNHVEPDIGHDAEPPHTQDRRVQALAAIIKIVRNKEGKSIETASKEAGVGHMTWRRLEEGNSVRASTYAALDKVYNLEPGTVLRAVNTNEGIVNLALHFAIGTIEAKEYPPHRFVALLAGAHPRLAVAQGEREAGITKGAPASPAPAQYQPEPGLPQPSGAERILVQATGPDGERTYLRVTGVAARRLELVTLLSTDLGRDKNRDSFAEDLRQMLAKYSDHLLAPYRDEAFGPAGPAGDGGD